MVFLKKGTVMQTITVKNISRRLHESLKHRAALCHRSLKNLVLKNRFVVDAALVKEIIDEELKAGWRRKDLLLQKNSF